MAILEKVDPAVSLSQGDLLKNLKLFESSASWGQNDQAAVEIKSVACLVVSRPCVIANKKYVLVAMVDSYKENPKDVNGSAEVLDFLSGVRDGETSPDKFYLGQVNDLGEGRFRAHLDSLHRVALPGPNPLEEFLKENRLGRLSSDFARDLHIRAFRAFASLGFDDYGWMSDADLNWLVATVEREISEHKANMANADASGMAKMRDNCEKQVDGLKSRFQPYIDEQARRRKLECD